MPSALAYFTQDQADDIQNRIGEQDLGNSAQLALIRYLFTTYEAYAPDVYMIVDWADESPNAWYFMEYKRRFIVLTGGLVRVPALRREGLSIILAHLLAQVNGEGCTASADYTGIKLYLRQIWPDDLFIDVFEKGFPQIEQVFTLVSPQHSGGNPNNICREPSLDCRRQSMNAGASFAKLPSCAVPPTDFGIASATASNLSEVTLTFTSPYNQRRYCRFRGWGFMIRPSRRSRSVTCGNGAMLHLGWSVVGSGVLRVVEGRPLACP
ncbi:MAG: hypothetical protein ACRDRU_12710 [Pseudonocardiaceae bacterium]